LNNGLASTYFACYNIGSLHFPKDFFVGKEGLVNEQI